MYTNHKEIYEEINLLRTDPKKYSEKLLKYATYFKDKVLHLPGCNVCIKTEEGEKAFKEAAEYLSSCSELKPFIPSKALHKISLEIYDKAKDSETIDIDNIFVEKLIAANGKFEGDFSKIMEFCSYSAEQVVINCIVCDGDETRYQRDILLNPDLTKIGIAFGPHNIFTTLTVICSTNEFINSSGDDTENWEDATPIDHSLFENETIKTRKRGKSERRKNRKNPEDRKKRHSEEKKKKKNGEEKTEKVVTLPRVIADEEKREKEKETKKQIEAEIDSVFSIAKDEIAAQKEAKEKEELEKTAAIEKESAEKEINEINEKENEKEKEKDDESEEEESEESEEKEKVAAEIDSVFSMAKDEIAAQKEAKEKEASERTAAFEKQAAAEKEAKEKKEEEKEKKKNHIVQNFNRKL